MPPTRPPPSGEITSLALKPASCSTVKPVSSSSSCGARNSSSTTHFAGNTVGLSATPVRACETTVVSILPPGGCGWLGDPGAPGVFMGAFPGGCGCGDGGCEPGGCGCGDGGVSRTGARTPGGCGWLGDPGVPGTPG